MEREVWLRAGTAAHEAGRLAEAEAAYRRVLGVFPDDAEALKLLGILRWHRRDPLAAEQLLRRSLEVRPDDESVWLNLGNLLRAKGDLHGARQAFARVTELAPRWALGWLNLGACLRKLALPEEAVTALRRTLEFDPHCTAAYYALTSLLYRQGRVEEVAEVYRAWNARDPAHPIARHMLAATTGSDVPARADDEYVQCLFDRFAADFDSQMQALGYRGPALLAERLRREVAPDVRLDILDAGCGTGLAGPLLRPIARRLVGVDLSPRMIEKSRARQAYDELVMAELSAMMGSRQDEFDAVVCADTFIYFGVIEGLLAAAHTCLRSGGWLAFTAESHPGAESYCLGPHGRYSHSAAYLRAAPAQAGFVDITLETAVLRRERGVDVTGYVVLARS
jgi:predicted TPR repeat methyltransferase